MTPRRTCATAYFASAAMMRMSVYSAIVMPNPIACPLSAVITGLRSSNAGGSIGDAENEPSSPGSSQRAD
jgi:tetrahydromethanopterin S-methyltransferase subunit E